MIRMLSTAHFILLALLGAMATAAGAAPSPFESTVAPTPKSPIDKLVFGKLDQLGIQPANLCTDSVFLRRAYLDVIGTLPTALEARDFLMDTRPGKRAALIDRLLAREEFADYWAMKWCDLLRVKSEFPINLWPNAVQSYHRWIRDSLRENKPYDRFVREMLTSSGSNFRVAPVNFYRAVTSKDAKTLAQMVALSFMGSRADKWPKEKLEGMSAFFTQVGYKGTDEWKEEIVFYDPAKGGGAGGKLATFPDGTKVALSDNRDPREVFADWLISAKNLWFARTMANRAWAWLMGRGIVNEPDDFRDDNPPVNPELLDLLARDFVAGGYDLKALFREILNSQAYQLSPVPRSKDPRAEANFAAYPLRRLEAEVLADALNQITGTTEKYSSAIPEPLAYIPEKERSISLDDASITSSFLEMFGRPSRDTGLDSERNNRPTADQRLHMLNSSHVLKKIENGPKLAYLMNGYSNPRQIVSGLYLMILSRFPTEEELLIIGGYSQATTVKKRETLVDLAWALLNSPEFLYRH